MVLNTDKDALNFINILDQDSNGIKLTKVQRYSVHFLVSGLKKNRSMD